MPVGTRVDPLNNFDYLLEIDGIIQAGFSECTGFGATTTPIEYREGGENKTVRKLPGLTTYNNITLRWGLSVSRELYDWHRRIVNGNVDRRNGSIILLDQQGEERLRWDFKNAWPTSYDAPDLNASANDVAIETLELAVEELARA